MRNARAVKGLCNMLDGLQGGIALFRDGLDEVLLSHGYPRYRAEVEAVRSGLEDQGLYGNVTDALVRPEFLVQEGKYDEAMDLVLDANRKLSKASDAEEDLQRRFKAAND